MAQVPSHVARLPAATLMRLGDNLVFNQEQVTQQSQLLMLAILAFKPAQERLCAAVKASRAERAVGRLNVVARGQDGDHDQLVAIVDDALDLIIRLHRWKGQEADAALLTTCRDTVLPEGRAQAVKPWHEEASLTVQNVDALLEPQRARLAAEQVGPVNVLEVVDALRAAARGLGMTLAHRAEVSAIAKAQVDMATARAAWLEGMRSILGILPLSGLSEALQLQIVEPFHDAVRMYLRRLEERRSRGEETPIPEDEDVLEPEAPPEAP